MSIQKQNKIRKQQDIKETSIEFHMPYNKGENVPGGSFNNTQKYSYCGPGTRYNKRKQQGYIGVNKLDRICKEHDGYYTKYEGDPASKKKADQIMIDRIGRAQKRGQFKNFRERVDAWTAKQAIKAKKAFTKGDPNKSQLSKDQQEQQFQDLIKQRQQQ